MPVTTGEIIAWASTDYQIKASKFCYELIQAIGIQLLHIFKVDQISFLIRLLPPTSKNISVYLWLLNRNYILEGDTKPMKGYFRTTYPGEEREEIDAVRIHVFQDR